jgi:hypothetical protein
MNGNILLGLSIEETFASSLSYEPFSLKAKRMHTIHIAPESTKNGITLTCLASCFAAVLTSAAQ